MRNLEKGKTAARQFGAEYQANPGSNRHEYLDDSAFYFGESFESFQDLPEDLKIICRDEFQKGIEQEKLLQ